jgi:2-oxoglutarate dehydrogenase E1 component
MYKKIAAHPGTRKLYADKLVTQRTLEAAAPDAMVKGFRAAMDAGKHTIDPVLTNYKGKYAVDWSPYLGKKWTDAADTALPLAEIKRLAERITTIPPNLKVHPLVEKVIADRAAMGRGEIRVDWGMGEHLAYASLVASGYPVRLSGEDSGRGTFTHRHAVLHDQNREKWNEGSWIPLQHVADNQAPFVVIDSILSEEAVLGFEYGYASADPNTLVIWEAQFGDFVNGAQVVIDQFIASGEVKWGRVNGITLMLPHGYEGQGPEHSSARLERFLQLCAENNMQVCVPSTPAQMYHMIRRQILRSLRKPLIVMTPKSLLRHELSVSSLEELANGEFATVIDDVDRLNVANVHRVVMCSGKVYFDLLKQRRASSNLDVALVRVEQLYPFPVQETEAVLARYPNAREVVWCQEEPQNQGAWYQIRHRLATLTGKRELLYAGRPPAAAPATGITKIHETEQRGLIEAALTATNKEDGARETKRLTATPGPVPAPAAAATSR